MTIDNVYSYLDELKMKVVETEEEFIFETIIPFCESITQMKLSKQDITDALLKYQKLQAENEALKARIDKINKMSKL